MSDPIHLQRDYHASFCGLDVSYIPATYAAVDATCTDCASELAAEQAATAAAQAAAAALTTAIEDVVAVQQDQVEQSQADRQVRLESSRDLAV